MKWKKAELIETESRMVVARDWGLGQGVESLLFNGQRVSVWEDEKSPGGAGDDGYTRMWIYLTPLNCTLKNGQNGKFQVTYISPQC